MGEIGGQTSQLKVLFFLPDAETNCLLQIWLIWIILCVVLISLTLKQTWVQEGIFHQPCWPQVLHPFFRNKDHSVVGCLYRSATSGPFFSFLPLHNFWQSQLLLAPLTDVLESGEYVYLLVSLKAESAVLLVYFLCFSVWFQEKMLTAMFLTVYHVWNDCNKTAFSFLLFYSTCLY